MGIQEATSLLPGGKDKSVKLMEQYGRFYWLKHTHDNYKET